MAEDDEIDILGDFNLDSFLIKTGSEIYEGTSLVSQNSELLNCDYTIHPQWLLDKPSANPDNWYDTNLSNDLLLEKTTQSENDGHVLTENCITDESGWTEKEKNLLERGIEIFGKSNIRLAQFVGSKTPSEVKYYLKNFYQENSSSSLRNFNESNGNVFVEEVNVLDLVNETQIPASIEEVIAAVSTAQPTVTTNKKARKKTNSVTFNVELRDIPSGHSVLKSNYVKDKEIIKKSKNDNRNNIANKQQPKLHKGVKFKFKTKLKVPYTREKKQKSMKSEKKVLTITKAEITTGKGLAVPICEGEEIVKIKKDDSDEDVEVDIEDSDEEKISEKTPVENNYEETVIESNENIFTENDEEKQQQQIDLSILDPVIVEQLTSLEEPKKEEVLKEQEITEIEKVIHSDFFEGRPTKTPTRYLKIRNHIINTWLAQKPIYVTKTSIRQGLKNCGDVNCIGRIHYFLEQFGVINFGCSQFSYVRPLSDMLQVPSSTVAKEKNLLKNHAKYSKDVRLLPRQKKKFTNDGEGGCTLMHDEKGDVINTTIVNEEPVVKQQRVVIKKPQIQLIYCRPFTAEQPQKYKIRLNLSTLLTMDFHAHTSLTEVMGLIGGYWSAEKRTLEICHYEPCTNIESTTTHCDMCPISQAKAADVIHNNGLDILGWFHSHPTFAPEPSQQDLDTQQAVQQWIGTKKPCIGVILSPFSLNGALIASPYRCLIVDKKMNFEDQFVPFKFKVDLVTEEFDLGKFLRRIEEVFWTILGYKSCVDFMKPYFQDSSITFLDKFVSSVRMYLAKSGNFDNVMCEKIIDGIRRVCTKEIK